ncbi:MAG: AAA family ATPase, partial [Bryobacteraceae bacterium]
MLLDLVIEKYAVVDRLRVRFHPGLNLLTGETGSGKSIVVDTLALLLGGRAAPDMVRSGAERARISGRFTAPGDLPLDGVEPEEGELLIEREVLAEGKSRAFVNHRPVTASLLRELAPRLGDIHGQHEQQILFSPDWQLRMLDAFAGTAPLAGPLFERWRAAGHALQALERGEQETLRLVDLWTFQRQE